MPAYAYPIKIQKSKRVIYYEDVKYINRDILSLKDLKFVGNDIFIINGGDNGGYEVTITRKRLETNAERKARVEREETYMKEYKKRH